MPPYGDFIIFDGTSSIDCIWDLAENYTSLTIDGGYKGTIALSSTLTLYGEGPECQINGTFYVSNAPNPNNPCMSCQPFVTDIEWSNVPDGTDPFGGCASDINGHVCKGGTCGCASDDDCASDRFCSEGICIVKFSNGDPCIAANQCSSNYCVDSVCCDSPCNGLCEVCSIALGASADGICSTCPSGQSCCVGSGTCVTSCSTCPGANYSCSISNSCVSSCSNQCSSYSNCPLSNSCVPDCFSCGSYDHTCLISPDSFCVTNCLHIACPIPPGTCN